MNKIENCACIIVAGGKGTRLGGSLPKQFLSLNGKPVLQRTIEAFLQVFERHNIITVISRGMEDFWRGECVSNGFDPGRIAYGGETRWESVKNGLTTINDDHVEYVMVHDAARPLVTVEIIENVYKELLRGADGVIPVVRVSDSMRELNGLKNHGVDRNKFRAVQTPQGFPVGLLREAFALPYSPDFTDEATMVERLENKSICLTEGSERNFKITTMRDFYLAGIMLDCDAGS